MADTPPNDLVFATLMATLRANMGPAEMDAASPEQTLQQRSELLLNSDENATLVGLMPTVIMTAKPAQSGSVATLLDVSSGVPGPRTETVHIYGSENLARWSEFTIHNMVGKGGMGQVFLAGQNALRREVAIKTIIPEHLKKDDAHVTESSFISEALVTGYLDHPNIVPIYSLGRDTEGKWFFSMKMVRGIEWRNLLHPDRCKDAASKEKARARNLDVDSAQSRVAHLEDNLRILFAICNAVAFAHSKGIIHRDLKPENVMVGAFGEVLVMDWGLAVDVSETPAEHGSLERRVLHRSECSMGGTPAYMSPEQFEFTADGRYVGARLDRWTDVFLLGGMLHELITGNPPYVGTSLNDVFMKISNCEPPKLSDAVPAELAGICRKALAKNPAERYPNALEFQQALQNFLKHREAAVIAAKAKKEAQTPTIPSLARAVVLYDQALELWPDNADYKSAEGQTRMTLAGLEARARLTRFALIAAVASILIGLSIGFIWIRAEEKKAEAALKQQTLLSFEAVVANAEYDDDYERVQASLSHYLSDPELVASPQFIPGLQLLKNVSAFTEKNKALHAQIQSAAPKLTIYLAHDSTLELQRIPAGSFLMGSPDTEVGRTLDEGPQHTVSISAFYMGVYAVTQEQYEAVTGTNPSAYRGAKQPVESISWLDAAEFCGKLNKRLGHSGIHFQLPTEAEWEYACRAGTTTRFSFGDKDQDLDAYGWYKANSHDTENTYGPQPVGLKKPNAFGLYDMHGNVFQWCHDWYASAYYAKGETTDPQGPKVGEFHNRIRSAGRVLRGGSWDFEPVELRSAARDFNPDGYRSFRRGFRISLTISTPH